MIEPNPITYRMLHNAAAGYTLSEEFFTTNNIDPNAIVKCNCNFYEGHENWCDIVSAHNLIKAPIGSADYCFYCQSYHIKDTPCMMPR